MRPIRPLLLALSVTTPCKALAEALDLPADARLVSEQSEPLGAISLPSAPLEDGIIESLSTEGSVLKQAWQLPATGLTTFQLLAPLRSQLEENGFRVLLDCADRACGGFEFRYEMDLLPEPAMHVDLGDFRYLLAARETGEGAEYAALTISRTSERGFIHVTRVIPQQVPDTQDQEGSRETDVKRPRPRGQSGETVPLPVLPDFSPQPATAPTGDLADGLAGDGHSVLSDLTFETGSSQLADTTFSSLEALANWMNANPSARIVLVGHTDAEGALESNISLSRKRATAVKERLESKYGIAPERLTAEGVGFLAPLASNATDTGRTQNRRVEVVLVSEE